MFFFFQKTLNLSNNFFLNFGDFVNFLHKFKKILAINYKKAQCYNNAWLFFKMSHHSLHLFLLNIQGGV